MTCTNNTSYSSNGIDIILNQSLPVLHFFDNSINLLFEPGKENSYSSRCNRQRNQQQTSQNTCGQTNKWNDDIISEKRIISTCKSSRSEEESGRSNAKSSSNNGQEDGSCLYNQRSNSVDEKLLVGSYKGKCSSLFNSGKKPFNSSKIKTEVFEFGEDSVFSSKSEKVEFTNTFYDIVLREKWGGE